MKTKVEVLDKIISSLTDEDLSAIGLQRVNCVDCNVSDSITKKQIHDVLKKYGIRPNLNSYRYITDMILICQKEPNKHFSITKLYKAIAEKYSCSCTSVERCVRYAVETSMDHCPEQYYSLLGNCIDSVKCKPTNAEFIAAIIESIK